MFLYNKDAVTASGEGMMSHSSLVSAFSGKSFSVVLGSSSPSNLPRMQTASTFTSLVKADSSLAVAFYTHLSPSVDKVLTLGTGVSKSIRSQQRGNVSQIDLLFSRQPP